MRQLVRRRHDGPHRLLLRLPRDAELRHAADARHRLPLSQLLPVQGGDRAGRPRPGGSREAGGPDRARWRRRRHRSARSCRGSREAGALLPGGRAKALRARARGARRAGEPSPAGEPIHPQYLTRLIDELAAPDAIFTADVGTPTVWAARYLKMNGRRRLIGSFNHGSMANAMLQAIGAQAAFPGRQVVSLSGDGGFA